MPSLLEKVEQILQDNPEFTKHIKEGTTVAAYLGVDAVAVYQTD